MVSTLNFIGDEVWINSHEIPAATLDVETEMIDVTPVTKVEPDPKWTYIDARGHFHAFDRDGELPTLRIEMIRHDAPADPDEPEGIDTWWEERIFKCRICGDVIEPRYTESTPTWRETVPGKIMWTVEARWPGDVLMPTPSEIVSVRIRASDHEYFGLGLVTGRLNAAARDLATIEIAGTGKLASRKI